MLNTGARTLRSVASAPSLRRGIRNSAPSTNPSSLLNHGPSQYTSLSVQSLKQECRKKGLKVSGRKAELVDRLSSFDASKMIQQPPSLSSAVRSQPIHSTKPAQAKDDSSTVDYCLMPQTMPDVDLDKPIIKIPVPPDAFSKVAEDVDVEYQTPVPDNGAADVKSATVTGTAEEPRVHVIHGEAARNLDDIVPVSRYSGNGESHYQDKTFTPGEFSSKDKSFFAAFAATITGWWFLGKWTDKKDKQKAKDVN